MPFACAYIACGAAAGILTGLSKKLISEPFKAGVDWARVLERALQRDPSRAEKVLTPEAVGQWLLQQLPLPDSAHQQRQLLEYFEHDRRHGGADRRPASHPDVVRAHALLLSRAGGGSGDVFGVGDGGGGNDNNNGGNISNNSSSIDFAISVDARSAPPDEPLFFAKFADKIKDKNEKKEEKEEKEEKKNEEEEKEDEAPACLASSQPARGDESPRAEAASAVAAEMGRNKNNDNENGNGNKDNIKINDIINVAPKPQKEEEEDKTKVATSTTPKAWGFVFKGDWNDLEDSDSEEEEEKKQETTTDDEEVMEIDEVASFSFSEEGSPSATSAPLSIIMPAASSAAVASVCAELSAFSEEKKEQQAQKQQQISQEGNITRVFSASSLAAAAMAAAAKEEEAARANHHRGGGGGGGRPPLFPRHPSWAAAVRPVYLRRAEWFRYEESNVVAFAGMQQAVREMDERDGLSRKQRQLERERELRELQQQQREQRELREREERERQQREEQCRARQWSADFVCAGKETLHAQLDFLEAQRLEQRVEARRQWDDPPIDVLLEDDERGEALALATPPPSPPRPRLLGAEAMLAGGAFHCLASVEVVIAANTGPAEQHAW